MHRLTDIRDAAIRDRVSVLVQAGCRVLLLSDSTESPEARVTCEIAAGDATVNGYGYDIDEAATDAVEVWGREYPARADGLR